MIHFFRKVRQRLLIQKRLTRYLVYAFGEILLVVIGILIALQINNWNESQKQEEEFKNVLEQLYNTIISDIGVVESANIDFGQSIQDINQLIYKQDSISDNQLIYMLLNLDDPGVTFTNEHEIYLSKLPFNLNDEGQIKILKQVGNYLSGNIIRDFFSTYKRFNLNDLFDKNKIPRPYDALGHTTLEDHYTESDIQKIRSMLKTAEGISALKNVRHELRRFNLASQTLINDAETVTKMIRDYMPDVRLLYEKVGIVGTAVNGTWDNSKPMVLVDDIDSIWEIELELSDGEVKFRTRNSWVQNWGGKEFPNGKAEYYGQNIKVKEEGRYKIRLNLYEETYEFIKIE